MIYIWDTVNKSNKVKDKIKGFQFIVGKVLMFVTGDFHSLTHAHTGLARDYTQHTKLGSSKITLNGMSHMDINQND